MDRFLEYYYQHQENQANPKIISDKSPKCQIFSLVITPPTWLKNVERRIGDSIAPEGRDIENDGRWLGGDTANGALSFFRDVADLFPVEPYIYSSRKGDLVAEFSTENRTLTCIVSSEFVLLFCDANGNPTSKKIDLSETVLWAMRAAVQSMVEATRTS